MILGGKLLSGYGNNMDQDCVLRPVQFSGSTCASDVLLSQHGGPRSTAGIPWKGCLMSAAINLIQF